MVERSGLTDIVESIKRSDVVLYLAWTDIRARYRRSVLGPFWITLGTAIGVVGLGYLWSTLLRIDRATFIPSLAAGLILWQLISGLLTESATIFARQGNVIRNFRAPYFVHCLQLLLRQVVTFTHNSLVVIAVIFLLDVPVTWQTLWVIPAFILLLLNLLWLSLLVGICGARFRDIEHGIAAMMPLFFFISPVLYRPDQLPFDAWIIWINPFSYFIEIVRPPLLGIAPEPIALIGAVTMALAGWGITLAVFNAKRHRIAFWA
jgi:ABC-type polysaccharide/polyol phosphate export permease